MTSSHEYSNPVLAYFFRSCVAFYNAKPWKLLGETEYVRINIGVDQPVFANVTGATKTKAPGLSLILAFASVEELKSEIERELQWEDTAFSGARVFVMFLPEQEVPQWLREVQRVNKWPLASTAAFPTFGATEPDGTMRELTEDELFALCLAMSVVTTFVATKRKRIEARKRLGEVVTVRDDGGAVRIALVQFPFDPDVEDGASGG